MNFQIANPEPRSVLEGPRRFVMPHVRSRQAERIDFCRYRKGAVTASAPSSFFASLHGNVRWWIQERLHRIRR